MPNADHDQIVAAIEAHNTIFRALQAETTPEWLQLDLSMAQLKAVLVLAYEQSATIGTLAQRLGVGLPTASHLTERLVQAGLAERIEDRADRRRTLARLSAEGHALVARLQQGQNEQLYGYLAQLSATELHGLLQGLHGLARVLTAQTAEEH